MMRQYELVERVKRYNPSADEALLNRAYVYAMMAHGGQKRASGDLFFGHPLEVAAILTDLKLDDATIAAAVLHDTVEDTDATLDEIKTKFGRQIGELVDGLTKIKRLDLVSKRAAQGENFRKLLLAIAADVRVLLVKLADRLHNMRTLDFMPADKRKRIAEETLDIYAPLAGRMGIQEMRDELEDLAFRHLHSEAYETISRRLRESSARNERVVEEIERELAVKLASKGIEARVRGRKKRPYSIWRKMERKSVAFEQLSDIVGFRIIVDTVDACYQTLGIVHTTWPMVPGRYKDYISTPKQNDYRSIHTTVIGPGSQRVELQIRTAHMDEVANTAVGCKINGRMAPLLTELQNGDEVEIVRADGQTPPAAWESLVVTGKARAAIRRATRSAVRKQYAGLGGQILERAFERAGKALSDEKLKGALPRLARASAEDVLAAVGRGEMFSGDVVRAVYPEYRDERRAASEANGAGWVNPGHDAAVRVKLPNGAGSAAIPIRGLDADLPLRFAPGGAVPGDRIVGILTPGEGVTVYPIQSPALADFDNEPDRWLDVRWEVDTQASQRFPARITLQSVNEPGSLAQIAQVIADHDGNIDNVAIDLTVWDLKHLNAIIAELRAKRAVSGVERATG